MKEKAKEAEVALQMADKKKAEYEVALVAVEKEREAEHDKVKAIMYDIEMTLKEEIEFVQNKAELTTQGKSICNKVLPLLLKLPDMKINIESHTNCKKGICDDGCHLMDLSQDRVDTVRSFFEEHGASNEFHTKGWGCRHPELKNVRLVRIYPDHAHHETIHVPAQ
jgi:outer membrane protein OmpA-like peptidoglycan-associated protein